jgi:hypothetical protein
MHGQYIKRTDKQLISQEDTFLWLSRGDPKAETESKITAAQNHTLQTKYYATKILQTETDSKCRLHQQYDKSIHHTALACQISAKEPYRDMTERVQLHFNIRKEIGVKLDKDHWNKHISNR